MSQYLEQLIGRLSHQSRAILGINKQEAADLTPSSVILTDPYRSMPNDPDVNQYTTLLGVQTK